MGITPHCGSWLLYNKATGKSTRYFCGLVCCDRPECKSKFHGRRLRLIADLMDEYGLDKFFTLTMTREMTLEDAWKSIAKVWHKFLTMTRRVYPGFVYVAVLESHKDGFPHIHGFTQTWVKQEWYADIFAACGGGNVAWVEKVSGDAAAYVSKQLGRYVGKQNLCEAKRIMGKRKRTIWRSKGLKTKRERQGKSDNWILVKANCFDIDGKPLYDLRKEGNEFSVYVKQVFGNKTEILGA